MSKIDPRLVDHGERVGYIAKYIYNFCDDKNDIDFSKLFILCALHDIGAYKTEEIDDMVRFETKRPHDHSMYGYLFLKNTSHLADYAEALLYHHTDYSSDILKKCRYAKYSEIIFLADRVDILMHTGNPNFSQLRKLSGTKFNPTYVDALFRADEKSDFLHKISTQEYKSEVRECIDSLDIKNNEIMDYLKLLVYAIDFRSPYTVTHTVDTTIISLEIGKLLSLNEHELQTLYIGSFLHDIGKIAISHTILEKPARLTADEISVVQRHIPEGNAILRGVMSDEICDIALRHHEKLDGSGYSLGLSANDLTLPQRITAVADILSALSQKRSYKEPFPKEKVIAILTDMKDKGLICPKVVETACVNYDMILRKTEQSHDPVKLLYKNLLNEYAEIEPTLANN